MIGRVETPCEHVDVDVALAFVDGALPDAARAEVEARIDACATCRGLIAAAARDAAPPSQPPTVHDHAGPTEVMPAPSLAELVLAPGEQIERYVVERAIGTGGMGVVALARDTELRRAVVIKLVRPDLFDDDFEVRLLREARAMAQVSHANVVQIFDIGRHRERVFLAMEYVPGQTLDAWMIEKPRTRDEVIAMFRAAGAGLAAAHRAGLVHRDFKPSNVLVSSDGIAKVTDFGLARTGADVEPGGATRRPPYDPPGGVGRTPRPGVVPDGAGTPERRARVSGVLTQANAVLGTPAYMSPEQGRGEPVDARTDQYAFALALLDALVDQRPTARRVVPGGERTNAALAEVGVAEGARGAIVRALAEAPAARFASVDELLAALVPVRRRRRRWPIALAIALAAAAGAAAVFFALRSRAAPEPLACRSETAARWSSARAQVQTGLASAHRTFASWTAAQVVDALDAAFGKLAEEELHRCERGQPSLVPARCLADVPGALGRLASLEDPALALLAVRELGCASGAPSPREADLARRTGELREALTRARTAVEARALAARAASADREDPPSPSARAGFAALAGEAHETAARLALAMGDLDGAALDFDALQALGERTGLDGPRGRGHLGQLDLARHRGNHKAAVAASRALAGMLERRGRAPADALVIALADGAAFTELGDVARAFAAWERAGSLATTPDAEAAASAGLARARWWLRWDATSQVTPSSRASIHARMDAWLVQGELALVRKEPTRAAEAFARARESYALVSPTTADEMPLDVFRLLAGEARLRALRGDLDGALASLGSARRGTAQAVRLLAGKARILVDVEQPAEAERLLSEVWTHIHPPFSDRSRDAAPPVMSHHERIEMMLALCDLRSSLGNWLHPCGGPSKLTSELHPDAPVFARIALIQAEDAVRQRFTAQVHYALERAVAVLVAANGPPNMIADLSWRLARDDRVQDRLAYADRARALFAQTGRTVLVEEVDAWKQRGAPADPREPPAPPPDP